MGSPEPPGPPPSSSSSSSAAAFGVEFWDRFHEGSEEPYEWYVGPSGAVAALVDALAQRFSAAEEAGARRAMNVGSGLSTLGEELAKIGASDSESAATETHGREEGGSATDAQTGRRSGWNVLNADASAEAIALMQRLFPAAGSRPGDDPLAAGPSKIGDVDDGGDDSERSSSASASSALFSSSYRLVDLCGDLPADLHDAFELAIDKGTLDGLVSNSVEMGRRLVKAVRRGLREGAILVLFSGAEWERRRDFFPPGEWELVAEPFQLRPADMDGAAGEAAGGVDALAKDDTERELLTLDEFAPLLSAVEADLLVWVYVIRAV